MALRIQTEVESHPKTQEVRYRERGEILAGDLTPSSYSRWEAIAEGVTIQSTLVRMKEQGYTVQDRRKLYVDLVKISTAMVAKGVDTVDPDTLRHIFGTCEAQINQAARVGLQTRAVVGDPEPVCLPARKRLCNNNAQVERGDEVLSYGDQEGLSIV